MTRLIALSVLLASAFLTFVAAFPAESRKELAEPDPSLAFSTVVGQQTFINKGLVAFGLIPSNFRESTGDTLGGIGSAIALKRGSFKAARDGSFTGTLVVQPDRGFNVDETINYQGRQHQIDFVLKPYYGTSNLSFNDSQSTLKLNYKSTLLYKDRFGVKTSGLDPLAVRPAEIGFPLIALANPVEPIPNKTFSHLSLDAEGLVLNADGTFWVSDEYGPYIHRFDHAGNLLQTLQPPDAILPRINGTLNFTSVTDPDTGRVGNQGFEGLTLDENTQTLWALLQSATVQDGGDSSTTSRFTRLVGYDVRLPLIERPPIVAEYVVPLPVSKKNKTFAASELHFVKKGVFLVLSRDGHGHGDDTSKSDYKGIDLLQIGDATNIHNTKFDKPSNPIATKGVLDSSITPVTYIPFVNILNSTQLARFGLHNGDPSDATLIDGKWESIALTSVDDPKFPDDYFLFTGADNDFITTQGISLGQPYNAGVDNDNQFLVYRVTLPGASARN